MADDNEPDATSPPLELRGTEELKTHAKPAAAASQPKATPTVSW